MSMSQGSLGAARRFLESKHKLCEFTALDGFDGLYCATRDSLRCTAVRLRTGGLCLFSPVQRLTPQALASLAGIGKVEVLLAPNHYHHKGLKEYAEAFPKALICASAGAAARLGKVIEMKFEGLDTLHALLCDGSKLVTPAGLKTGEVWVCTGSPRSRAWMVVDAFCGHSESHESTEPCILGTFPRFGIGDRPLYLEWLQRQIKLDRPTVIVPCHGAIVRNRRLPSALRRLMGLST